MKKLSLILTAFVLSGSAFAQSFIEKFDYPVGQTVGGSCITTGATDNPTCTSNNWVTTAGSSTTTNTINIVAGSLAYTGYTTGSGNKIEIVGDNTNVPRDIHRAFNFGANANLILYASFLLNVQDATSLSTSLSDNTTFFHFSNGASPNGGGIFSRVSLKKVNSNYRIGIANNTGGAPPYSEVATDLNFGTTYLIVMKYDFAGAANDTATLWVNPPSNSFGGTEPSGGAVSYLGTTTFNNITLLGIRNTSNTPKAFLDEIRVGTTWAEVVANILPVSLKSFSGAREDNRNALTWTTVTESNNKGFEIQRSENGKDFAAVTFISSKAVAGTSNYSINYEYNDGALFVAKQYYRLKQVDLDGSFKYSQVILISGKQSGNNVGVVYPNPVKEKLNLSINTEENNIVTIQVLDLNGRVIKSQTSSLSIGSNTVTLDVNDLNRGSFLVKVQSDKWQKIVKFQK